MSDAIRAKTASERATIAGNLLKRTRETNQDLGREFDDCFEMDDADEVVRILIERMKEDVVLRLAIRRNWQIAPQQLTEAVNRISNACDDFRVAGSQFYRRAEISN